MKIEYNIGLVEECANVMLSGAVAAMGDGEVTCGGVCRVMVR